MCRGSLPLEAIDTPPGAADREMTFIHGRSANSQRPSPMPCRRIASRASLLSSARKHFAPLGDYEEARAFWWTRFRASLAGSLAGNAGGAPARPRIFAELSGKHAIAQQSQIRSTARRRRSSARRRRYAILDYKTGQPDRAAGPQRTRAAARAGNGHIAQWWLPGIPGGSVSEIGYGTEGRRAAGRTQDHQDRSDGTR
jgi:hypothetical protein